MKSESMMPPPADFSSIGFTKEVDKLMEESLMKSRSSDAESMSPSSSSSSSSMRKKYSSRRIQLSTNGRGGGSLSIFRWTVSHLYLTEQFQQSLLPIDRDKLLVLYKQATVGENVESAPSCLFSFAIFASVFSSVQGDSLTPIQWQLWKNLGNMPKEEAADQFLELLTTIKPNFLDTLVDHENDPEAGPGELTPEGHLRSLSIREIVIRNAAIRIQSLVRACIYKKFAFAKLAQRFDSDTAELLAMLVKGINIFKLSVGGVKDLRKCVLVLRMSGTLATSKLCLINPIGSFLDGDSDTELELFLSDIADVRPGISSYGFQLVKQAAERVKSDCLSIIGSEGTFNIVLSKTEKNRSWFVRSFNLLIDKCLAPEDFKHRGRFLGAKMRFNAIFVTARMISDGKRITALLGNSFGVEEYDGSGATTLRFMWVDWGQRRLYLGPRGLMASAEASGGVKNMKIDDVSEIRCGHVSTALAFESSAPRDRILSIISTEATFHLLLSSKALRNRLCRCLRLFLRIYQIPELTNASPALHGPAARLVT